MKYSFVIPVYNRPEEMHELLDSMTRQTFTSFEVIVVEDGSQTTSEAVCRTFAEKLDIKYFMKPNSGPGQSRNYGAERAAGEYLIVLDSDVVLPSTYLEEVEKELQRLDSDAFGGPDTAHPSFSDTQKAISYTMTSFLTTGGIRGGKKKLDKFYPRSFNMGIKREVYKRLGGFSKMRFGEDIDFSIRIFAAGCTCRLFPEAWVWHKRRTDFRKFYRQVYNSGIARINLYKKYPDSLKFVHLLPAVFTVGVLVALAGMVAGVGLCYLTDDWVTWLGGELLYQASRLPLILFAVAVFLDALFKKNTVRVAALCVPAAFIQLMGYGMGFLSAWWKRCVMGKDEFSAFEKTFYK